MPLGIVSVNRSNVNDMSGQNRAGLRRGSGMTTLLASVHNKGNRDDYHQKLRRARSWRRA